MSNKIEQWIEALPKYEKYECSFLPIDVGGNLIKEKCACALGVYLIEVLKYDPEDIAEHYCSASTEGFPFWDVLNKELGKSFVTQVFTLNDDGSPTFDSVIKFLEKHVSKQN